MRSITCGTSLSSLGQIEVFDFARIKLSDIKRLENYAQCFHRINLQDDAFQGGMASPIPIRERHHASCSVINRFLGPCIRERSDTMLRKGISRR